MKCLYLHTTYIFHLTENLWVVDFLLCLACGSYLFIVQQQSESILALICPRYRFSKAETSLLKRSPCIVTDGTKIVRDEMQVGVQEMCLEEHIAPHIHYLYDCNSSPTVSRWLGALRFPKNKFHHTVSSTHIFQFGLADLQIFHLDS
jgi:hypothetical protein